MSVVRRLATALAFVVAVGCSSDRGEVSAPQFGEAEDSRPPTESGDGEITAVAMIGDSITVGATAELETMFATLGLDVVALDAQEGRRLTESNGDIRSGVEATAATAEDRPPDLWVIALGTNDVLQYDASGYRAAILTVVAEVPAEAPLVWVDVYVDAARDAAREFNTVLNELLARRRNAAVAPWSAVAGSDGMLRDGVHPSEAGNRRFAEVVGEAVGSIIG